MPANKVAKLTYGLHYNSEILESEYRFTRKGNSKIIIVALILSILGITVFFLFKRNIMSFLKFIFLSDNGNFQWVGVTAIVTILSFSLTYIATLRKNKADLVSKARIEWLNFHRKEMADYLTGSRDFYNFVKNKRTFNEEEEEKLTQMMSELEKRKNLLVLNLSDTPGNKQLNDCIEDLAIWVNSFNKVIKNPDNIIYSYDDLPYFNLLRVSRDYYKHEWEKVKKGK